MSQIAERTNRRVGRPEPDEAILTEPRSGRLPVALRIIGAVAVFFVGGVHIDQDFAADYDKVSVIGPLFVLKFAGATIIAAGLVAPLRRLHPLLALAGIGLAATSIVFLFISESQPLFGFRERGSSPPIVIALAAEAIAVAVLGTYLVRRRAAR